MSIIHSTRRHLTGWRTTAFLPALVASAWALGQVAQDSLPSVDRILERYVDAVGGRAAIERLQTRIVQASFVEDIPHEGPPTTVRFGAYAQVPGKWMAEWRSGDRVDRMGCDGLVGWEEQADTARPKDEIARRKEAFLFDPQGPLRVREYFRDLAVAGTVRVGDRLAYAITTDRTDAHYALYFDVETGLLIRVGYYWELADYRVVDGVKIPFRITLSRKGGSDTYVIATIEHNAAIDATRFAMPDAPRVP